MTNILTRKFALGTIGLAVLAVAIITMSSVGQSEGRASDLGYAQELAELYQETNTLNSVSSRPVTGSVDRRVDVAPIGYDMSIAQFLGEPVSFGDDPYRFVNRSVSAPIEILVNQGWDLETARRVAELYGEVNTLPQPPAKPSLPVSGVAPIGYDMSIAHSLGEPVSFGDDPYRFVNRSVSAPIEILVNQGWDLETARMVAELVRPTRSRSLQ